MKIKLLIIGVILLLTGLPLSLGITYLSQEARNVHRNEIANQLQALSNIAKKRILAVVDRVNDNTALVASRTQLRKSLHLWNETKDSAALNRIERILLDATAGLNKVSIISLFDSEGALITSTSKDPTRTQIDTSIPSYKTEVCSGQQKQDTFL